MIKFIDGAMRLAERACASAENGCGYDDDMGHLRDHLEFYEENTIDAYQALGLLSHLFPEVEIDTSNLMRMARDIAARVLAREALMERMAEALEKITKIENQFSGSDWEEIDEARGIASAALAAYKESQP